MNEIGEKSQGFFVMTLHRSENVDHPELLAKIFNSLAQVDAKIVLAAHPRLTDRLRKFGITIPLNIKLMRPLSHHEILGLLVHSLGLITDSGGLQKEAFILKVPCTTLRDETEWVETLTNSWNVLVPNLELLSSLLHRSPTPFEGNPFGSGNAAKLIVQHLKALGENTD
jgi:UDP-N-acetylglucosamine 2-epimerase (non-hydrolysing)